MNAMAAWWNGDWKRLLGASVSSTYFIYYASTPNDWHFIDYVDLIIHEAGHLVFLPFGEFIHILGGSLFQTIFPLLYVGYFYFKKDLFSSALLLFWVGVNLINVSVYAADAQLMQLPLLGGDSVIHDWNYILGYTHTIQYAPQIASCIYGMGVLLVGVAAIVAMYSSQHRPVAAR